MSWTNRLKQDAADQAKIYSVDEERQKAFINGALWTLDVLKRIVAVHPMEEGAKAVGLCDTYRLKEVNEFIRDMSKFQSGEESK